MRRRVGASRPPALNITSPAHHPAPWGKFCHAAFEVEFRAVSRHFGSASAPVETVDGVDLTIAEGAFFAMLGPSGSGKTTCLRLISGFGHPPRAKSASLARMSARCRRICATSTRCFRITLFPHMNVRDNVAYGLMVERPARGQRYARADEMLAVVQLDGYGDRKPGQLSGGQRQRGACPRTGQ